VVDTMQLWLRYVSCALRREMQYRVSLLVGILGQFLATGVEFIAIWALFDRFDTLRGWSLAEVALFYGVAHVSFGLADLLATGFDQVHHMIRRGELDRLLLRPRSTEMQIMGHGFALRRLGRITQGTIVLVWALTQNPAVWSLQGAAMLLIVIPCAACLFVGLFALQATMAIWTVQTLELVNATTYGGVFAAQHPFAIYAKWFRWLFTFIVPLACVLYWPLLIAMDRPDPLGGPWWLGYATIWAGPAFLWLSLCCWRMGLRHYTSTGS